MNSSRLERLQRLLQPDIDALPDLPSKPEAGHDVEDVEPKPRHLDINADDHHHSEQLQPPSNLDDIQIGPTSHLSCNGLTSTPFAERQNDHAANEDGYEPHNVGDNLADAGSSASDSDQIRNEDIPYLPNPEPEYEDYHSDGEDSEAGFDLTIRRIHSSEQDQDLDADGIADGAVDSSGQPKPTHVPDLAMKPGQLSSSKDLFCPIVAVSKFPYKYLPRSESERVADRFFNAGRFWSRRWDL